MSHSPTPFAALKQIIQESSRIPAGFSAKPELDKVRKTKALKEVREAVEDVGIFRKGKKLKAIAAKATAEFAAQPTPDRIIEAAEKASEVFPDKLGRLVVLHVPTWGAAWFTAKSLTGALPDDQDFIRAESAKIASTIERSGTAVSSDYTLAGSSVNLIALSGNRSKGNLTPRYTEEMAAMAAMDFALGLLITGTENGAEAYALLRHVQQFGHDTEYVDRRRAVTTGSLFLSGNAAFYTADTLEYAAAIAQQNNISTLLLRETARLAVRIANATRYDSARLEKVRNAYQPVINYLQRPDATEAEACRKTIEIAAKHRDDADIRNAGQRFLSMPGTEAALTELARDDYWKAALYIVNPTRPAPKNTAAQPRP